MYLRHFSPDTEPQNCTIPSTSSSLLLGLTSLLRYSFSSCHKFSMGFRSNDSRGDFHQLIPMVRKKDSPSLDVCLGSLSCIKRWPSGYTIRSNVCCKMLTYTWASMIPICKLLIYAFTLLFVSVLLITFKDANASPTLHINASPYVYLHWMLCP